MTKEPIMPNVRFMPATFATGAKYLVSGLRSSELAKNTNGKTSDSQLFSCADVDTTYPIVGGKDLYGRDLIVALSIRSQTETMYFPEAVVNVSRSRNIVATQVVNGRGSVKEMISQGDIDLSISVAVVSTSEDGDYDGTYTTQKDIYPYRAVERLRKMLESDERLDVVSDFLSLFGLDGGDVGIIVKNYSLNQETHTNRQVFEVQAVSDYDYNLLIEE